MKFQSKIISSKKDEFNTYLLELERPENFKNPLPGQFALIQIPNFFLRRPITFYDLTEKAIIFCYQVKGNGLNTLSKMKTGEEVTWFGPYGKGLEIKPYQIRTDNLRHPALHYLGKMTNSPIRPISEQISGTDQIIYALAGRIQNAYQNITKESSPNSLLFCQETMGCGVGACMSCVVTDKEGNRIKICQEGPFLKKERLL
ncbi:MAG: hypothetical protein ACOYL6_00985 [Bacteriovoracaceae bacterium]